MSDKQQSPLDFMLASLKLQRETRYAVKILTIQTDLLVTQINGPTPVPRETMETFAEISKELQKSVDAMDKLMDELLSSMEKFING